MQPTSAYVASICRSISCHHYQTRQLELRQLVVRNGFRPCNGIWKQSHDRRGNPKVTRSSYPWTQIHTDDCWSTIETRLNLRMIANIGRYRIICYVPANTNPIQFHTPRTSVKFGVVESIVIHCGHGHVRRRMGVRFQICQVSGCRWTA
ncbi:hypothetical protein BD410DRAFT_355888 [Rickenella mellea]|uniref:Uncharacterized protein n=1 Tax=Rickenella mellea TaxID=50990 RepID=A0A4Y7PZE6_9AGAM|nr:hypothetical protein BD410DRAFT_355888 [Rickenella mellea]